MSSISILIIITGACGCSISRTLLVTTQIEGGEAVVADGKLLGGRVGCGLQDGDTVVLFKRMLALLEVFARGRIRFPARPAE